MDKPITKEDIQLDELQRAMEKACYHLKELVKIDKVLKKYDIDITENFKQK